MADDDGEFVVVPWAGKFLCAACCAVHGLDSKRASYVAVPYLTGVACARCGESRTCFAVSDRMAGDGGELGAIK
jgi:hypothetical protein